MPNTHNPAQSSISPTIDEAEDWGGYSQHCGEGVRRTCRVCHQKHLIERRYQELGVCPHCIVFLANAYSAAHGGDYVFGHSPSWLRMKAEDAAKKVERELRRAAR